MDDKKKTFYLRLVHTASIFSTSELVERKSNILTFDLILFTGELSVHRFTVVLSQVTMHYYFKG